MGGTTTGGMSTKNIKVIGSTPIDGMPNKNKGKLKIAFQKACFFTAAAAICYGVSSGFTTGISTDTADIQTKGIDARSAAKIEQAYQDKFNTGKSVPSVLLSQKQADLDFMNHVNHEILDGPSDWNWFLYPHDANLRFNDTHNVPKMMLDSYKVTTVFSDDIATPSLTLRDDGSASILTLNRNQDPDDAARQGIKLLERAYQEIQAAAKLGNAGKANGIYTLTDDGVTFEPDRRLRILPVPDPSS